MLDRVKASATGGAVELTVTEAGHQAVLAWQATNAAALHLALSTLLGLGSAVPSPPPSPPSTRWPARSTGWPTLRDPPGPGLGRPRLIAVAGHGLTRAEPLHRLTAEWRAGPRHTRTEGGHVGCHGQVGSPRCCRRQVEAGQPGGTEPDPRFTFANERTFLAWSRTALALVVAGLGIVQLLPPFPGVPAGRHLLGVPLIALGAVLAVAAYAEWVRNQRALRRGEPLPLSIMPWILAATITAGSRSSPPSCSSCRPCDDGARSSPDPSGRRPRGARAGPGRGAHVAVVDQDRDRVRGARRHRAQGEPRHRTDHLGHRPGGLAVVGRVSRGAIEVAVVDYHPAMAEEISAARLFLITISIVGVALLCLVIAILGRSAPGALR